MQKTFHFSTFDYYLENGGEGCPSFAEFGELGFNTEDDIEYLHEKLEEESDIYCFQYLPLLYLRILHKREVYKPGDVELRVYSNRDNYTVVRINDKGELSDYPKELHTWNDVLFELI